MFGFRYSPLARYYFWHFVMTLVGYYRHPRLWNWANSHSKAALDEEPDLIDHVIG